MEEDRQVLERFAGTNDNHVEREKQLGGETGYNDAIFFMRTLW